MAAHRSRRFYDVAGAGEALFDSLWQHFAAPSNWRLYDDVCETWHELAELGLLVGVASNFDDRLQSICRGLEPLAGCPHLFWSAKIGFPKPSQQFFRSIESALKLPAQQILLVGDDPINDDQGARAAGWQSILIDRQHAANNQGRIRSLRQLLNAA